jgi:predicted NodU family carbamoyl transferase
VGIAIEAQYYHVGRTRISWSVYSGQEFEMDADLSSASVMQKPLNPKEVAQDIFRGEIVALAQGRAEIGPRGL